MKAKLVVFSKGGAVFSGKYERNFYIQYG